MVFGSCFNERIKSLLQDTYIIYFIWLCCLLYAKQVCNASDNIITLVLVGVVHIVFDWKLAVGMGLCFRRRLNPQILKTIFLSIICIDVHIFSCLLLCENFDLLILFVTCAGWNLR